MEKTSKADKRQRDREFVAGVHEALVKAGREARRLAERTGTRFVVYADQEPEDSGEQPRP